MPYRYRVSKQFGPDQERDERYFAEFDELDEAKFLVEKLLEKFATQKPPAIFRIYKTIDLVQESSTSGATQSATANTASSSGAGQSASARPNPFSTTLRPSGMPAAWGKKEDDEKKK